MGKIKKASTIKLNANQNPLKIHEADISSIMAESAFADSAT